MPSADFSFLPDDYFQRRTRRRSALIGGCVLAGGAIVLVAAAIASECSLRRVEKQHAQTCADYQAVSRQFEIVAAGRGEKMKLVHQAALARALGDHQTPSGVLAALTEALPVGATLSAVHIDREAAEARPPVAGYFATQRVSAESRASTNPLDCTSFARSELVIKADGLADSDLQVTQYLQRLNRLPSVQSARLLVSEIDSATHSDDHARRRFQIELAVNR